MTWSHVEIGYPRSRVARLFSCCLISLDKSRGSCLSGILSDISVESGDGVTRAVGSRKLGALSLTS